MSDQFTITSETALIMEKMVGLEPTDPRYQALKAAVDYKASWVELAERLNILAENKDYKDWGFKAFKDYCAEELQIHQATARKLVRGFQWIDREAPQLLPKPIDEEDGQVSARDANPVVLPDVDTVNVLMKAERELKRDRLDQTVYDDLKERALMGTAQAKELSAELKEAVIVPEKDPKEEQLKTLRRTLSAAQKIVTQLEEVISDDEELREIAEKLREKLFEKVSALLDTAAYGEGGAPEEAPTGDTTTTADPRGGKTEQVTVLVGAKADLFDV